MSAMGKLKSKWHYEKNVPRCDNCVHLGRSFVKLTRDSKTIRIHEHCKLGGFNVTKVSICDKWTDAAGTILEK